jgi:hypothetical protein
MIAMIARNLEKVLKTKKAVVLCVIVIVAGISIASVLLWFLAAMKL